MVTFMLLLGLFSYCQAPSYSEINLKISSWVNGTLMYPQKPSTNDLVILISDYGPTDRNGNQNNQKNDAILKIAKALAHNGIASFRYDKRTFKQILNNNFKNRTSFNDFIKDAKAVLNYFKKSEKFDKLYVMGHGQGSLVGMLAAESLADGFISVAGFGKNIGDVIVEQINILDTALGTEAQRVANLLKGGNTTKDYPEALSSVFDITLQPFMISWMHYNPAMVISRLQMPILIIHGTKDLNVSLEEAELLKESNPRASLKIIENMNHVLVTITGDNLENAKSINQAYRALSDDFVSAVVSFIKEN